MSIPQTQFHTYKENPMLLKIREICPNVENAAAQYFYSISGRWRSAIHEIKYHKAWFAAYRMGKYYGYELAESPLYQDIDLIVPVPLHRKRLLKRRYNQSEILGSGIGRVLKRPLNRRALQRVVYNDSQVSQTNRQERWDNVQGIFSVARPKDLENKHILLIDDVFTTGATMISCIETITAAVPSCRISVVTMAVSKRFFSYPT